MCGLEKGYKLRLLEVSYITAESTAQMVVADTIYIWDKTCILLIGVKAELGNKYSKNIFETTAAEVYLVMGMPKQKTMVWIKEPLAYFGMKESASKK